LNSEAVVKRREANQKLVTLLAGLTAPVALFGCSKAANCSDVSALSADELRVRNETAKYVESSPDAAKKCSACSLFKPSAPKECGACQVVKGPINPEGYCTLFVAKPA
jgi:hypothetical protein